MFDSWFVLFNRRMVSLGQSLLGVKFIGWLSLCWPFISLYSVMCVTSLFSLYLPESASVQLNFSIFLQIASNHLNTTKLSLYRLKFFMNSLSRHSLAASISVQVWQ